ncbi:MAG: endonuclease/exonuclease/phosphatase family protein [Carboxylicivirga sp.]|jgi:endonuclease/exonuclease/phosphatase family metal-dependent hydrolase|nr:endonuclease/exonuclease/phosphatase family protein [Carboxylicivirga sp.]
MNIAFKLKYILAILLLAGSALCYNVKGQNLRVLTFNIWDPGDYSWWEKRGSYPVDAVVDYLTEDNADVLILQEVTLESGQEEQVYARIKRQLEEKGYQYTAFYRPDYSKGVGRVGYISGMSGSGYPLVILSKLPIQETYAVQTMDGKTMSKGVLGVKVLFNNESLYVFNTHLSIGSPFTDEEVSKVALPFVNSVVADSPVIFAGDWNSPSAFDFPDSAKTIGQYHYSSKTTQPLLDSGFVDVYPIAVQKRDIQKDATCPGQDDYIKRVDRIYSRNTNLRPVKAWVKENPWEYIDLVDHLGVVVEFEVMKDAGN